MSYKHLSLLSSVVPGFHIVVGSNPTFSTSPKDFFAAAQEIVSGLQLPGDDA